MTSIMQRKTLDPQNQFVFTCPVFNANTKIAGCFMLRDLVWRGERPETRRGCQVAMHASKCPINDILKEMVRTGNDPYHSQTPIVGKLKDEVLDRIAPVRIPEQAISSADLPPKETLALRRCNEESQAHAATGIRRKKVERRRNPTPAEMPVIDKPVPKLEVGTVDAAKTGDMSAALNAEIKASDGAK